VRTTMAGIGKALHPLFGVCINLDGCGT